MKRVIYTVLTGAYDHLVQPQVPDPSFDYICFTDHEGREGVWQLRTIPFSGTPLLRARWAKLHPHVLLPDFDLSIYMDANLCIAEDAFYQRVQEHGSAGVFSALPHPRRDCVWDELRYCYLKDKLSTRAALRHHKLLEAMGMPRHWGLYETGVLVRRHLDPTVMAVDEAWWAALSASCPRDQLSLTPVLWRHDVRPGLVFPEGSDVRNVSCLRYELHPLTGQENTPGKLNWANIRYNLRLAWRKTVLLLCLK